MPSQPSFCTPGRPARNLSVTSLPSPTLRNVVPGNRSVSLRCADRRLPSDRVAVPRELERRDRRVVDLAEVVVEPRDLEPLRLGRHHPPRQQVVERGAPQHGLLAAGVHRDVAADARGVGRRRIDRRTRGPRARRRPSTRLRDDAGAAVDRRRPARRRPGSATGSTGPEPSSFSVLMTAERGVSGTAPPV